MPCRALVAAAHWLFALKPNVTISTQNHKSCHKSFVFYNPIRKSRKIHEVFFLVGKVPRSYNWGTRGGDIPHEENMCKRLHGLYGILTNQPRVTQSPVLNSMEDGIELLVCGSGAPADVVDPPPLPPNLAPKLLGFILPFEPRHREADCSAVREKRGGGWLLPCQLLYYSHMGHSRKMACKK